MTYQLGPNWIKCLKCNRVSYHHQDVAQRYCANCHTFHEAQAKPAEPKPEPKPTPRVEKLESLKITGKIPDES